MKEEFEKKTEELMSTDAEKLYEIFKYITLLSSGKEETLEEETIGELFNMAATVYQRGIKDLIKEDKELWRTLLKRMKNSLSIYKEVYGTSNNK